MPVHAMSPRPRRAVRTCAAGGDMRSHLLAAALLLSPMAAAAAATGPEFGFRAAYSVPLGDIVGDGTGGATKLSDLFSGGIPIQLDVGYRFTPAFYGGIFGSYGFLFPTN